MAANSFLRSNTLAGIIFRTVLVIAAWFESLRIMVQGVYLFTPGLWAIYHRSQILITLVGTLEWLVVIWVVVLLPEKRSWTDVGWIRGQISSNFLLGGFIGSGVYLCYVGMIAVCRWYWIDGHYAWSHILAAFLISLLNALGLETLYQGYVQHSLEQKQGSGIALTIASLLYASEPLIVQLVRSALNSHTPFTFSPSYVYSLILYTAMGLFFGAVYLWSGRLWTAVGVYWGNSCMDYLLTYNAHNRGNVAVFRFALAPHSFDPNGIGSITKVMFFLVAAVVMIILAKRRGHWQVRGAAKSQS